MGKIDGLDVTPLKIIETVGGNVLHAMKSTEEQFVGFGEVYFSTVHPGIVKAWKKHRKMTLNLVVPVGKILFVCFDDRKSSPTCGIYNEIEMSIKNYQRLTVPPMIWMGFQGTSNEMSLLLNVASIPHEQNEMDIKDLSAIKYDWRK